jgi:hypothetical protein
MRKCYVSPGKTVHKFVQTPQATGMIAPHLNRGAGQQSHPKADLGQDQGISPHFILKPRVVSQQTTEEYKADLLAAEAVFLQAVMEEAL